jgi:hypothetical protein
MVYLAVAFNVLSIRRNGGLCLTNSYLIQFLAWTDPVRIRNNFQYADPESDSIISTTKN